MVCLDLSTAFYTVNHKILLDVFENYFGIAEQTLSWITSYLSYRSYSVQIEQDTSKIIPINFSVILGSIKGPFLFNCYASTLKEIIQRSTKNSLSGYTDHHVIVNSFNPNNIHIRQNIENDIRKIKLGCRKVSLG